MGALFSRGSSARNAAALTAAKNAEAAVQAAKKAAAFPPMPAVSAGATKPPLPAEMEIDANRAVVEMLNKSHIVTRDAPTAGATATAAAASSAAAAQDEDGDDALDGTSVEDLVKMFVLHAQNPDKWTTSSLAKKYGIVDEVSLANALAHCQPYRIITDDESTAAFGVPVSVSDDAVAEGETMPTWAAETLEQLEHETKAPSRIGDGRDGGGEPAAAK